jgi:hypothetical protein
MITHNNFNYLITYIMFSCIGHEEVLLQLTNLRLRTPKDDAQGTVICRPPRVQSKKESHAISFSLE